MKTHTGKTQENNSQSVANEDSQKLSSSESTFQFVDNRPEAVAQRKLQVMANSSSQQVKQAAQLQAMHNNHSTQQQPIQKKENNTGLPDKLKTGMENLSGMSLDDVRVHRNSDKPAQLQAHAYAQGSDIHLAPGQEKHLPHELGHVVQQKQGRVKPTLQMKGKVNVNDDAGLEKEADVFGAKALQFVDNRYIADTQRKHHKNTPNSTNDNLAVNAVSQLVKQQERTAEEIPQTSPRSNAVSEEDNPDKHELEKQAYNDKQIDKIEGYRKDSGELNSKRYGGFIGVMKGKMVDVVKTVQADEGSIQQADNYIHGDAAVNSFFDKEITEAKAKDLGAVNVVNAHAKEVLRSKYQAVVMPGGGLQTGPIGAKKSESLASARQSKKRVEDSAADRVIVEMYYNQVEKIKKEPHTSESKEKAADIYKFAKARKFDVEKRKEDQKEERDKLEKEGRISTVMIRAWEATKHAVGGAALKFVTLGLMTTKKNRDKRGFVAKEDFTLDIETGEATPEKFTSKYGTFDFMSPMAQIRIMKGEFDAKMGQRKGLGKVGFFSALSLGLEVGKRFLGFVKGLFSSVAIWTAGLSLIPGAQALAGIAAFCGTVSYYIGLVMTSISTLRIMLDGMTQIMNDNPALFSQLSGETKKSVLNTTTEAAAYGMNIGASAAREEVTGQNRFDVEALYDPTKTYDQKLSLLDGKDAGPEFLSPGWIADKSIQGGGIVLADGAMAGINAGATAGVSDMDNNDARYTQTVNENRKIGKDSKKTASADSTEIALIMEAYETTKEKAKNSGARLIPVLTKFAGEKAPAADIESSSEIEDKDKKQIGKIQEAGKSTTDAAKGMKDGLEDVQNK